MAIPPNHQDRLSNVRSSTIVDPTVLLRQAGVTDNYAFNLIGNIIPESLQVLLAGRNYSAAQVCNDLYLTLQTTYRSARTTNGITLTDEQMIQGVLNGIISMDEAGSRWAISHGGKPKEAWEVTQTGEIVENVIAQPTPLIPTELIKVVSWTGDTEEVQIIVQYAEDQLRSINGGLKKPMAQIIDFTLEALTNLGHPNSYDIALILIKFAADRRVEYLGTMIDLIPIEILKEEVDMGFLPEEVIHKRKVSPS